MRRNRSILSVPAGNRHMMEKAMTLPADLVLLDEAHAARRAKQEEREFNSSTLLLGLLRRLQLEGHARGLLLLSATPMQTTLPNGLN